MIKKLILLTLFAAAGYVGYLVWGNLTEKEKVTVKSKVEDVAQKGKDLAERAAGTITEKLRGDEAAPPAPTKKKNLDPPPRQPGKVVIPAE